MKNKHFYHAIHSWKLILPTLCGLVVLATCMNNQYPTIKPLTTSFPTKVFQSYDISDGGFLSGEPCGPPCFWDLLPGATTEEETLLILRTHIRDEQCEPWDDTERGGDRGIGCLSKLYIKFDDDVIRTISFEPSETVNVGDVLVKYGNPDGLFVVSLNEDKYGVSSSVKMFLHYNDLQTTLHLPEVGGAIYTLMPSAIVEVIQYSDFAFYNRYIEYNDGWQGFIEYPVSSIP